MKNPFPSRKQAYKTLGLGYLFSFLSLFVGFGWLSSFQKYGYFVGSKSGIKFYGDDALLTVYGVILLSSLLLIYTLFWTIWVIIFDIKDNYGIENYPPENVICPNCKTPFLGSDRLDLTCPTCGEKVEDLEGFYDRHPEFK